MVRVVAGRVGELSSARISADQPHTGPSGRVLGHCVPYGRGAVCAIWGMATETDRSAAALDHPAGLTRRTVSGRPAVGHRQTSRPPPTTALTLPFARRFPVRLGASNPPPSRRRCASSGSCQQAFSGYRRQRAIAPQRLLERSALHSARSGRADGRGLRWTTSRPRQIAARPITVPRPWWRASRRSRGWSPRRCCGRATTSSGWWTRSTMPNRCPLISTPAAMSSPTIPPQAPDSRSRWSPTPPTTTPRFRPPSATPPRWPPTFRPAVCSSCPARRPSTPGASSSPPSSCSPGSARASTTASRTSSGPCRAGG